MQKINYEIKGKIGSIYWAASESFKELSGKKHKLNQMEATEIEKIDNLSPTAKILLSAVAGAVIQHCLDLNIPPDDIFSSGIMEIE